MMRCCFLRILRLLTSLVSLILYFILSANIDAYKGEMVLRANSIFFFFFFFKVFLCCFGQSTLLQPGLAGRHIKSFLLCRVVTIFFLLFFFFFFSLSYPAHTIVGHRHSPNLQFSFTSSQKCDSQFQPPYCSL